MAKQTDKLGGDFRLQDCLYCHLFVFEQATQKWWANFREIWGTSRLWIREECTKF